MEVHHPYFKNSDAEKITAAHRARALANPARILKAWRVSADRRRIVRINTLRQQGIFDGVMLSDGQLQKKTGRLAIEQKADKKEYLEFLQQEFGATTKISERSRFDKRTGRTYHSAYSQISGFRKELGRWYPAGGVKRVPADLTLSPLVLLHWFLGDGTAHYSAKEFARSMFFYTNGFLEEDVELLRTKLLEIGVPSSRTKENCLHVLAAGIGRMYDCIGSCPVGCYAYKWELSKVSGTRISFKK